MFLPELVKRYNSDESCRAYMEELRWPKGPECPTCGSKEIVRVGGRQSVLRCKSCERQFTVTVGTIFHDSHLPLTKWFLAILLLCEAKKGMSALQMQRTLGMGYKTAWYLCHRIREAMVKANSEKPKLSGIVEIDETYIGPRDRGGKRGRGASKQIVIGIRERNGKLRLFKVNNVKADTLSGFIRQNVDGEDVDILVTDEYQSYPAALRKGGVPSDKHQTVNHTSGEYVVGKIHTNTVESAFSLLKRGLVGSWHKVSMKHLQRYLEEMSYRFEERDNPQLFSVTLKNLLTTEPLTFNALTTNAA